MLVDGDAIGGARQGTVGGRFGRGVMQDVSDKLLGQFANCLETKLDASQDTAPEPEVTAVSEPAEEPSEPAADDVSVEADADTVAHASTVEPDTDTSQQSDS